MQLQRFMELKSIFYGDGEFALAPHEVEELFAAVDMSFFMRAASEDDFLQLTREEQNV